MEDQTGQAVAGDGRFLVFTLDGERYAVEVKDVEVVLEYTPITRVPRSADYLRGVINHRGTVVPVADLKMKFGMGRTEELQKRAIIVMHIDIEGELTPIGIIADLVEEVIDLETTGIEPPPRFGSGLKAEFISGLGKKDDRFIILLDMAAVFADSGVTERPLSESASV